MSSWFMLILQIYFPLDRPLLKIKNLSVMSVNYKSPAIAIVLKSFKQQMQAL